MGGFFGHNAPAEQGVGGGFFGRYPSAPPVTTLDALVDLAITSAGHAVGVTAAGNAAWTADDGVSTHAVIAPVATMNRFQTVVAGNGIAVAMGQNPLTGGALATSADNGHTWTETTPAGTNIFGVYFSPLLNGFLAWDGNSADIYTSSDGVTWTSHVGNLGVATFTSSNFVETGGLIYTGTAAVGVTQVYSTPDGITYTQRLSLAVNGIGCTGPVLNGTLFGAAPVTSLVQTNDFWTSPTGAVWTKKSASGSFYTIPPYPSVAAFGGLFVSGVQLSGDGKTIATSPDGITWTDHAPTTVGLIGLSAPAIRATTGALYEFGIGCAHTADFITWTLDVAVANTVNQVKEGFGSVVGCGSDAGGNGLFFKLL